MLQTNEMTAILIRIDRETGRRGAEKDWALDAYCQIMAKRHQSINNLRADLRNLLTEMGNIIMPMGTEKNYLAQKQLKNAGIALDAAYYTAVASSNEISATEYRQRTSKDYLSPEEIFECEKFRIKDAYGMEVTSTLVQKDNSGKLIRAIADLEAILSEPDGTIWNPKILTQHQLEIVSNNCALALTHIPHLNCHNRLLRKLIYRKRVKNYIYLKINRFGIGKFIKYILNKQQ
ncbi:hypothetical protein NIES4075_69870 [Tolypothrix sp. NIES-4075]|nr:hypothetical protein NIES4075_69870 [Tolypothrix sp. NIES-4075]